MPWRLVVRYMLSHRVRLLLTLGSLIVAVFLVCVLRSLIVSLRSGVDAAASNRLVVQSAVSLFVDLPLTYQQKIEQVEGVDLVCKLTWFGGIYQDASNFFGQFGVDHDRLLDMYPEIRIVDGSAEAFHAKRTACLIGGGLAEDFKWKVGDTVPIIGQIFPRSDGDAWQFEVAAIYEPSAPTVDRRTLYFRHDYLEESIDAGGVLNMVPANKGVGVYAVRVHPGADVTQVMADIDLLFDNGPQRVQTTSEAEFSRQFVTMFGNVPTFLGWIGGAVLFAIALASINTMLLAGRERTRDFGVLKALGFTDATAFALLLCESLLLCLAGGAAGVALALLSEPAFKTSIERMFPNYAVRPETIALGLGLALIVGLVAGIVPAWSASRLKPVDALRAEV